MSTPAGQATTPACAVVSEARTGWWREARIGMFVHYGLYAQPARGEWVQWDRQMPVGEYAKLAQTFMPAADAGQQWARAAQVAGARYIVFTTRHHDGFALFDTKTDGFNSVAAPVRRDIVREFADAARAAKLRVGFYYSPLDWRRPGFFFPDLHLADAEAMRTTYHGQMRELVRNYGKIDVLWFDGGERDWLSFRGDWHLKAGWTPRSRSEHYAGLFDWRHGDVHDDMRAMQPDVVINGRADMSEDFRSRESDANLGDFDARRAWELATTVHEKNWGWNDDGKLKAADDIVRMMIKAVGRDGNYLLNVGPKPDGSIASGEMERLRVLGSWLQRNGRSVYGTRGGPYLPGKFGVSTRSCLLHVLARMNAGLDLVVCHVDHGLSGQSEQIATEVARTAAQEGYDVHVARAKDLAGPNLHARAREFRYSFFQTIAAKEGAACIATGHTLDDRVETTMARFIHGAGGSALAGIPAVGESLISHITRVRPLVSARRTETRAYCDEVGLSYVDDPSNEDPRFERAVVRQMVLAPIEDHWGDGAIRAMAKSVDRIAEDDDALDAQAHILYAGMIEEDGPKDFDLPTFLKVPRALRRRLLELAVGPKRDRGAGIDEVLDALERDDRKPGANFDLPGGTTVVIAGDKLSVIDSSPS